MFTIVPHPSYCSYIYDSVDSESCLAIRCCARRSYEESTRVRPGYPFRLVSSANHSCARGSAISSALCVCDAHKDLSQATGWFVTHGGHNGVMESITAGVPMYVSTFSLYVMLVADKSQFRICWPYSADQPVNSAHLSSNLHIAYELFEVRSGVNGLKPLYRTGKAPVGTIEAVRTEAKDVLTKAFGEDGEIKRANVIAMKKAIASSWEENGASQRDLETFVDSIVGAAQ